MKGYCGSSDRLREFPGIPSILPTSSSAGSISGPLPCNSQAISAGLKPKSVSGPLKPSPYKNSPLPVKVTSSGNVLIENAAMQEITFLSNIPQPLPSPGNLVRKNISIPADKATTRRPSSVLPIPTNNSCLPGTTTFRENIGKFSRRNDRHACRCLNCSIAFNQNLKKSLKIHEIAVFTKGRCTMELHTHLLPPLEPTKTSRFGEQETISSPSLRPGLRVASMKIAWTTSQKEFAQRLHSEVRALAENGRGGNVTKRLDCTQVQPANRQLIKTLEGVECVDCISPPPCRLCQVKLAHRKLILTTRPSYTSNQQTCLGADCKYRGIRPIDTEVDNKQQLEDEDSSSYGLSGPADSQYQVTGGRAAAKIIASQSHRLPPPPLGQSVQTIQNHNSSDPRNNQPLISNSPELTPEVTYMSLQTLSLNLQDRCQYDVTYTGGQPEVELFPDDIVDCSQGCLALWPSSGRRLNVPPRDL